MCAYPPARSPAVQSDPYRLWQKERRSQPLGSLAFSRFLRPGSKRLTFLSLSSFLSSLVRRNRSVNAQFAAPAVKAQKARAMTTTASALPLAEIAAVGPEIAEVAVTCFAITLVGLAIGFVLLRVESAVEGEE